MFKLFLRLVTFGVIVNGLSPNVYVCMHTCVRVSVEAHGYGSQSH